MPRRALQGADAQARIAHSCQAERGSPTGTASRAGGVSERIAASRPTWRQCEVFAPGGALDQPSAEIIWVQRSPIFLRHDDAGVGHPDALGLARTRAP